MLRPLPVGLVALLGLVWPTLGLAQDVPVGAAQESQTEDSDAAQIGIAETTVNAPTIEGLQLGGFTFLEATRRSARSTNVNPSDLFDLSSDTYEAAVIVEGAAAGFTWRLRGDAIGTRNSWPERVNVRVKELSYQRRIGQRWSISVGKQERSWDAGLSYRPLGFFRTQPDLSDVFDNEGRQEGIPLLSVTYVGDSFVAEAVVSDDVFSDIDDAVETRQWAARVSRQFGKVDASLVVRQAAGQTPGVGGSASYSAGAVELHADLYVGPGGRQRIHRALSDPDRNAPNGDLFTSDPFILDRVGRGPVVKSVVGVTWAPSSELGVSAEYIHRGDGLSGRQWSSYLGLIASHRAALDTSFRSLAIANLAYDLNVLGGSVRKDYLFIRGSVTLKAFTLSASTLAGLADGSATLFGSATYKLGRQASAVFNAVGFVGGRTSEYGLLPFGTIVSLSLRRTF